MICELCDREVDEVQGHHLIPQTRKSRRVKRDRSKEERTGKIWICRACHDNLHALFTEKKLELELNSLDRLKSHPDVEKFIQWISTKSKDFIPKTRKRQRS